MPGVADAQLATYAGYATTIVISGWRALFLIGIAPALLVVVIRLRLREPDRWLQAAAQARQASRSDEFHQQMGDLREIFRNRVLLFHTLIGMTLGMAGQTGLWGI